MYSPANQAFIFVFGDAPLRLDGEPMLYRNKADAIRAAQHKGLVVDRKGFVQSVSGEAADFPERDDTGDYESRKSGGFDGTNQKDYTHYLVVVTPMGTRIESGWSYVEDAQEHKKDNIPQSMRGRARVLTKTGAKREGLDPDDEASWWVFTPQRSGEVGGLDGARKFNQRDYQFYVVVHLPDGPRIESGWEYRDDAKEQTAEGNMPRSSPDMKFRILTKTGAKREGLDPDDNANWITGHWWTESNYDAAVRRGVLVRGEDEDAGLGEVSPRTRQGTRVVFNPSPGSLVLYRLHPEPGEEGSVTTMPGFGKHTYLPGPGGGLLYVNWDEAGTIGVSPNDVDKVGRKRAATRNLGEHESDHEKFLRDRLTGSMNYGDMPPEAEFVKSTKGHYPYPLELVGEDKKVIEAAELLDMRGVEEFASAYPGKLGIRVDSAETMYSFLEKLVEVYESDPVEGEGLELQDAAGRLASSILYTLGYEWV
jgi:hypothetical protein